MKLYRHVVQMSMEGTVSQICFIYLSFCFMKSRKKKFLKLSKSFPFFQIK